MRTTSANRRVQIGALVAGICLTVSACGGGGATGASSGDEAVEGEIAFEKADLRGNGEQIVLFTYAPMDPYISTYTESLKSKLESMNYKLKVFTNRFSQSQQDQQVQQYLASGAEPALFLFVPFNAKGAINSTRLLARAAPVIQLHTPVLPEVADYVSAYSGLQSVELGRMTGEVMKQAKEAKAKSDAGMHSEAGNLLAFLGSPSSLPSRNRYKGFMEATNDEPFNVLEEINSLTADEAYKNALTLIPKYKDEGIDFVWVYTGTMAGGVLQALQESGLEPGKDVTVVTGNCTDHKRIEKGAVYGSTLQAAFVEGTSAAFTALQFLAADGKVTKGSITYPATAVEPDIPLKAPHEKNFIPLRPITGSDTDVKLWGKSAAELCIG